MVVHVAVVDPLPMYRQGVAAVLTAAGHTVETPSDVAAWVSRAPQTLVLLTLESERDWEFLGRLRGTKSHVVIALLADETPMLGVRAVRAGARSVLPRWVTAQALRRTVEATIDGQTVLPAAVAAALAVGTPTTAVRPQPLTSEQVSWLRQLAAGSTVAQLANQVGYSDRAMFRLLRRVYKEMGVRTRVQAIVRAQEWGWLTDPSDR